LKKEDELKRKSNRGIDGELEEDGENDQDMPDEDFPLLQDVKDAGVGVFPPDPSGVGDQTKYLELPRIMDQEVRTIA
jgi:hypothetical protein